MLLVVALAAPASTLGLACRDNMFTGSLTPVPPVHRLPPDVAGAVILLDTDPVIETKDPSHVVRANEQGVPRGYREAMAKALELGGFKVTAKASDRHDLVARLAIAVSEDGDDVRQVYRCGLVAPGTGSMLVAQIDWSWPKGTYVETLSVFDFATHNVATEVVTSPRVLDHLRSARSSVTRMSDGSDARDH